MIIKNKILISNIPYYTEERTVASFFADRNFKVKMLVMSRGEEVEGVPIFTVVDFGDEKQVERALDELGGRESIEGSVIGVRKYEV